MLAFLGASSHASRVSICYASAPFKFTCNDYFRNLSVTTLYGIKNCDTVKKARQWLEHKNVSYHFHDVRNDGLDKKQVADWVAQLGWENVVNKRSTSWKELPPAQREAMAEASAIEAIIATPTLFKRPLLAHNGRYHVGFKPADYEKLFS